MNPVVLQGGEHIKSKYREVVLQQTDKLKNGRAVWSSCAQVPLHLYSDDKGKWCLSDQFTSEEQGSAKEIEAKGDAGEGAVAVSPVAANDDGAGDADADQTAAGDHDTDLAVFVGHPCNCSEAPPQSEHVWMLGRAIRSETKGNDKAKGKLTLLCGEAGKARVVRGLTQHSCASTRCDVLRVACAESAGQAGIARRVCTGFPPYLCMCAAR